MTSPLLSRRRFLVASGLGAAALAAARVQTAFAGQWGRISQDEEDPTAELISYNDLFGNPPLLGRVHGAAWLRIFTAPTPRASSVDRV
ncbi:MAG: twin-arginine translocation signal domain-containing protein, partial [Chloroflexota bacterium]